MDTKLKNSKKWLGNLIVILLILLAAAGTILGYRTIHQRADGIREKALSSQNQVLKEEKDKSALEDFVMHAYMGGYGFYWDIQKKLKNDTIEPFDLFFPEYVREAVLEEDEENYGYSSQIEQFNERFKEWNNQYQSAMLGYYGTKYQVVDNKTGEYLTNASEDLAKKNPEDFPFYMKYTFDQAGGFHVETFLTETDYDYEDLAIQILNKSYVLDQLGEATGQALSMEMPKDITIYLMSEVADCFYMGKNVTDLEYEGQGEYYLGSWVLHSAGLTPLLVGMCLILALAALLLPFVKKLGIGTGTFGKLPFELMICLIWVPALAYSFMGEMIYSMYYHEGYEYLWETVSYLIPYAVHFGLWCIFYGMWFVAVLSARQIFSMGLIRYCKEKVWCIAIWLWIWKKAVGICRWIVRKVKGFFRMCVVTLDDIDLTDPSSRMLLKILGLNFIIVFLCCVLWYFGVAALILYTVILFFVLKKYMNNIKEKYNILLRSTRRMAEGDLQAEITEDTGIFEPLTKELNKVQVGFRKAVEEEIKSQNMKTELITNVSHDLKTPLTAIITYVNLLKDEHITEEERNNYINILDRKSLRLKQLIEDLFEVSKAASGNIKIEKKMLNLTDLIKQAAFELEDRLSEAKIECRVSVPEKEVLLELDGEKTYRCLENLLINVAKYGMEGTRAYLNLYDREKQVEVVLKNISREELTMNVEELTERFIRGDKSRNTEGSGLGLAIVKSFVELQGGSFWIEADGDLFKACMRFPKQEQMSAEK